MSAEHYFTRGMFIARSLRVSGDSPMPQARRQTTIDALVAKVLCRDHNTALSEVDTALIDFVNAIREILRLAGIRARNWSYPWPSTRYVVDGRLVERGLLKMLLNHSAVQHEALSDWLPPTSVARAVFGEASLPEGCGLGVLGQVGDTVRLDEEFGFHFGHNQEGDVDVVLAHLLGWPIACTWQQPLRSLGALVLGDRVYEAHNDVVLHPNTINITVNQKDVGLSLRFDWNGRRKPVDRRRIELLREKYRPPARRS